jgi:hypothetical protein
MPKIKTIKTDSLLEYNKSQADKLTKAFAKLDLKALTTEDSGTFRVIMTSDKKDRDGEIIRLDGWNFDNFMKNPVVIYGHNYYSLENVIGRVDKIYREGNTIVAEGKFASMEANPKAQMVRRLYDEKILQAVSVGFIVKGRDVNDDSIITSAELLELSFVPIQSNPDAVDIMKALEALSVKDAPEGEDDDKDTDTEGEDVKSLLKTIADGLAENNSLIKSAVDTMLARKETDAERKFHELKEATQGVARGLSEALRNLKK